MNNFTKLTAVLLLIAGGIGTASAQLLKKIGDNPYTLNPSAALEIESTTKGFLPPRMDTAARNLINNNKPAVGLLIYNTTTNSLEVNTGTADAPIWKSTSAVNPTVRTVTANTTVLDSDSTVLVDAGAAAGGLTLTLPAPAVANTGRIYTVGKINNIDTGGDVSFSPALKLDNSSTIAKTNTPQLFRVQSDGQNWYVID